MPSKCKFRLNQRNGVYFSGEWITGTVLLRTTKEKTIRNIRIRLLGEAKVHWSEAEKDSGTAQYKANEVYVDKTYVVYDEEILPPRAYVFGYKFRLPKSCPTSCRGNHGHIRYFLELRVDRPYRYDNVFTRPLTVLKRVDLNMNPEFKLPVQQEEISAVGCWPCASGNIVYSLAVPYGAYASGQSLEYTLNIQNQSMTDISGYQVRFVECMTFVAHTPEYKELQSHTTLADEEYSDGCLRLSNRQYDGQIDLPSMPPDTDGEGIIRLDHYLEIEIEVKGCHRNKNISVPIFIGNIPIKESLQNATPLPSSANLEMPSDEDDDDENSYEVTHNQASYSGEESDADEPPCYGDLAPPAFEEAVRYPSPFQDPEANEYTNAKDFQPLYPVYRYYNGRN